ncbi:MAG TPA: flavodoxin family protein [Syntrophorhabdaceae bacterium]|nr:flavodoxin family protein [Syntrophorhabdaceae bacterium]
MNIIVFNGSPKVKGNIDLLLEEALKVIDITKHKVKVFNLNEMNIKPCQDCGGCDNTGICIIEDDMKFIYEAIREADRIILASPVFFSSVSAQTKIMIDRCQSFWCEKYLLKKELKGPLYGRKGLFITVGGRKNDIGIKCSIETVKAFFISISIRDHEIIGFAGIEKKGDILEHPTAIKNVKDAIERLIQ